MADALRAGGLYGGWARVSECISVVWGMALVMAVLPAAAPAREVAPMKVPVILDTDIGDDIDDTWALAFLLRSPELDLRLVVTDSGDTVYRAKIAARLLEVAGRTDVPVGIGIRQAQGGGRQADWVKDYVLESYRGTVQRDGVQALIEVLRGSPSPVTLICIGPAPNVRAALERAPDIAKRARFVGMYGSVRVGYGGKPAPEAEWNVRVDPAACRAALSAAWPATITPLDTCSLVRLKGRKYAVVRDAGDPLAKAVIENYRLWFPAAEWLPRDVPDLPERESTVLFDTVAVYLAFAEDLLEVESLGLRVTDDGRTVIDAAAPRVRCATRWRDLEAFEDLLVARLAGR